MKMNQILKTARNGHLNVKLSLNYKLRAVTHYFCVELKENPCLSGLI